MNPLFSEIFLREVPKHLLAGLKTQEYEVYGSIIRSLSSGKIVGHLQETSQIASLAANPVGGLVGLVGQAASVVQNEQIKTGIAQLQSMQLTSLVMSGVSIGVSVAGTAWLSHRIDRVASKVDALVPQLEAIAKNVEMLRQDRIAEDFTRLRTLAAQVDECWALEQATTEWRAIARDVHFLADSFERRLREIPKEASRTTLICEPLLEAFCLASSLRLTARMASGDDAAARDAAQSRSKILIELGTPLQLAPLVLEAVGESGSEIGTDGWTAALDSAQEKIAPRVKAIRAQEANAVSNVIVLEELFKRDIPARDWIEVARNEDESALIYFKTD